MSVQATDLAACVSGYAARLHAAIGTRHHVASPLGAWLVLALAGPASTGADRAALTEVLGCDVDAAAHAAADLLTRPHPLVASAAAVWTSPSVRLPDPFLHWRDSLPAAVTTGDLPGQAGLDAWVREHTFGLIDRFPLSGDDLYLVLATALATKVSWQVPFDLAPAASLGGASPWAGQLDHVLRTPARSGGHVEFVAITTQAGDVIVHIAAAAGGLEVVSVAAMPDVAPGRVLSAAYDLAGKHASGVRIQTRGMNDLPVGESALWSVREVTASTDSVAAVLPAWSASSDLDLTAPGLGFDAARKALVPSGDPWQARQAAMARYSRTGFEAAAVSAVAVALAMRVPGKRREVVLRFGHPYAVVAVTTVAVTTGVATTGVATTGAATTEPTTDPTGAASPWNGLPVFSAWVSEPEDSTANASRDGASPS